MIRAARALPGTMLRLALVFALVACGSKDSKEQPAPAPAPVPAPPDAAAARALPTPDWAAHGLADAGCFVARDLSTGAEVVSDPTRCAAGHLPHSTFKIPNALIGLELGLLDGPDAVMPYDAKKYPKQSHWNPEWSKDQPLRKAMEISAVPLFQRLATEIGAERMQQHLDKLDYGNRDISGGIDQFWLSGGLRITARQQLDFVDKLSRRALPVSERAQSAVHEVLLRAEKDGARFFHKTGTGRDGKRWIGWLVGWIAQGSRTIAFAMWIDDDSLESVRDRRMKTFDAVAADLLR